MASHAHATKASVHRYYMSLPHVHGESSTAALGSVSRVPAAAIERKNDGRSHPGSAFRKTSTHRHGLM